MKVVNLAGKFATFSDRFNPRIVGELNNFQVKLVKVQGEFMWHHHDEEDEMFLVTAGELHMKWRDAAGQEHDATIRPGEPATTLNTGNIRNERTVATLEKV